MAMGIVSESFKHGLPHAATTIDGAAVVQTIGKIWYVDAGQAVGSNGSGTSWQTAFQTMAEAFAVLASGDVIFVSGKVTEQLVTPVQVFDVRVIGIGPANRHADATPVGGNQATAQWAPPASGAVSGQASVRVLQQGWQFQNLLFTMESSTAAGIELVRNAASGNDERDASHAHIYGCKFAGAGVGIRAGVAGLFTELVNHVRVEDCVFIDNTYAIRDAIGTSRWVIKGNEFQANTNHIVAMLGASFIYDNIFGAFTTDAIELPGGAGSNIITKNYLSGTYSSAGGYTRSNANDEWAGNFNTLSGGITVSDPA